MKKVSFVSFYSSHINNIIFNDQSDISRDGNLEPYIELKNVFQTNGYEINTCDITSIEESDFVIFLRLELKLLIKAMFYRKKTIYIQFEPPVIMTLHKTIYMNKIVKRLFSRVLTWNDDLVENKNFFKFQFPIPKFKGDTGKISFDDKKLLTNISGYKESKSINELYSKRIEAIKYFEKNVPDSFDLYGFGWQKKKFPSYRGPCDKKLGILKKYKFSLCFENQSGLNGLISEKIFDCFNAGCIPIFWGAENISEYIPDNCYIDKRKFDSYEGLLEEILNMDEQVYSEKLKSINLFLKSEEYLEFTSSLFAKNVFNHIQQIENKEATSILLQIVALINLCNYHIRLFVVLKFKKIIKVFKIFFNLG